MSTVKSSHRITPEYNTGSQPQFNSVSELKLKYTRKDCVMVATWLNGLTMDTGKICEAMHSKRGMWVRHIRALRLAEYAQRPGFGKLNDIMDKFYRVDYRRKRIYNRRIFSKSALKSVWFLH